MPVPRKASNSSRLSKGSIFLAAAPPLRAEAALTVSSRGRKESKETTWTWLAPASITEHHQAPPGAIRPGCTYKLASTGTLPGRGWGGSIRDGTLLPDVVPQVLQ